MTNPNLLRSSLQNLLASVFLHSLNTNRSLISRTDSTSSINDVVKFSKLMTLLPYVVSDGRKRRSKSEVPNSN